MEFIADKTLPEINGNTTSVKERIDYWQKIIKSVQMA
jgi:hypothetical protein